MRTRRWGPQPSHLPIPASLGQSGQDDRTASQKSGDLDWRSSHVASEPLAMDTPFTSLDLGTATDPPTPRRYCDKYSERYCEQNVLVLTSGSLHSSRQTRMKSSFKLHEIPATVRAAMCIVKVKPEVPPWTRVNIDEALFVHYIS
ncbi:hypothetical protein MJT46_014777 [Ovis ammon polii x Ovis aries]|nr:hypothetical protein MJT46_014777 [Ovis ammon polii x Ovis aries]